MFRGRIYFFVALIGIFAFLLTDYSLHKKVLVVKGLYKPQRQEASVTGHQLTKNTKSVVSEQATPVVEQSLESFKKEFNREVIQVGQLQNDPDKVESRMQALAEKLTLEQMNYLFAVMSNSETNGDERSLAVELLSLNSSLEAHEKLKEFIARENFSYKDRVDFEIALRAQAIEGLLNCSDKSIIVQTLNELKSKTKYSLLSDREERALAFIKGVAPSLPEQDNAALKKLITK